MKPHEETWSYTTEYDQDMGAALFANGLTFLSAMEWDREPDEARLKLAAQAPAMARVLFAIRTLDMQRQGERHFPVIDDLLRDAGVLP